MTLDAIEGGASSDGHLVKTYIYLRVSLIAAVLLVFAALVFETFGTGDLLNSISAYYYTPVRSVFVGALVGMGFALIALVGRPGPEDAALNLAGMLAPVVAFVPTPVPAPCPIEGERCIPEAYLPGVVNNMSALFTVGFIALAFTAFSIRKLQRGDRWSLGGFFVAVVVWVGALVWFGFTDDWALRESFLSFAHYGSAVPMFVLIIVVVFINGFSSETPLVTIRDREVTYRPFYKAIAVVMAATVLIGLVAWFMTRTEERPPPVIFWVEATVLLFFGVFWGLQTWELRRFGPPPPSSDAAKQAAAAQAAV
ncbi:hypothetical protein ACFVTX_07980 [Agromyces sp. NPDC058136]|uniref:hypothetical protein n=1 Tax=Agromyces sp. NPDC058136 TaxID=3346354 RepID=UPI0036DA6FAB